MVFLGFMVFMGSLWGFYGGFYGVIDAFIRP